MRQKNNSEYRAENGIFFIYFTQQKGNTSIMNVYLVCWESFGSVVQKKLQLLVVLGHETFTYQR